MANNLHKFPAFLANFVGLLKQTVAGQLVNRKDDTLPTGLFVQHTNPRKNQRRKAIKAVGGIRQFKKARRELRLAGQPVQF